MSLRTSIALIGYATMDFIAQADGALLPEGTNTIRTADQGWPRIGGGAIYAGEALLQAGHKTTLIANIGADAPGATMIEHLRQRGFASDAIVQDPASRTPVCVLINRPDGHYCCFLDRGSSVEASLSASQKAALRNADWIVISAGQRGMAEEALDLMRVDQKLAWIVKADAICFPETLRDALQHRAGVIFLNRHERDFLGSHQNGFPAHQLVFETDGERGVHIHHEGQSITLPTAMLDTMDTTGAGDTFAGATLAALIAHGDDVEQAACAGLAAATKLLARRPAH
ncbi:carbohydrate kinase family protein [Novosphingobium rosa]|uniref:carbohydrate kinase family protein n=1 Tax=Novosphingobium rosa TaxID=76978 RepID=UPI0008360418|nr:carbohydrate kinase family protein [Novosphingobium rosa]